MISAGWYPGSKSNSWFAQLAPPKHVPGNIKLRQNKHKPDTYMSTLMFPQYLNYDDGPIVYQSQCMNHRHNLNLDLHCIYFVRQALHVLYPLHSYEWNQCSTELRKGSFSFSYIVMKRNTSKLILAATTASPKRMKTKLRATYPGLFISAWSFCSAT